MTVAARRSCGQRGRPSRSVQMAPRLMLVAHAPTAAIRRGAFPADEVIERRRRRTGRAPRCRGARRAGAAVPADRRRAWAGPPTVDPGFADLDAGRWRGRALAALLSSTTRRSGRLADRPDRQLRPAGRRWCDLVIRVGAALDGRALARRAVDASSSRRWWCGRRWCTCMRAPASMTFGFDVGPLTAVDGVRAGRAVGAAGDAAVARVELRCAGSLRSAWVGPGRIEGRDRPDDGDRGRPDTGGGGGRRRSRPRVPRTTR